MPINSNCAWGRVTVWACGAAVLVLALSSTAVLAESASSDPLLLTGWGRVYPIVPPAAHGGASAADASIRGASDLSLAFIATGLAPEGDTASAIQFSPDGAWIVIAHRDSQNIVVLDAATRAVLNTIPLSGSPNALALSPDGIHAVTANIFEDTASIIDLVSGMEVAVATVGDQPGTVRITPDGDTAVVGNTVDSTLSVVDIATATEVRVIPGVNFATLTSLGSFAVLYRFTNYAITADSAFVIFPDQFNARINFFNIATGVATAVTSAAGPAIVDLSPDGAVAVVSHHTPESRVTVVDVATKTISKSIATGGPATIVPPIAMNPAKTKAVVAVSNGVRVVNLVTETVSGVLSTGSVNDLLATADGQYCVVGNFGGSLVSFATESIVGSFLNTTTPDYLAVSPTGPRASTAHALRKEFIEVMNVDGAAGFLEAVVPTGPPPEGDKARGVAVTADGSTAVVINNHSNNATIMDLRTQTVTAIVPVGERPGAVAVTPDGTLAVVANLDSPFASVIDLATATATSVNISRRGSQVAISPDGQFAYIPVVADGDGVWRISLQTMSVAGPKRLTGDMGGVGFVYDQSSGMTLSHDGATLVTCGSFTNNISIISTTTWMEVARVGVGDFPVRAAFSPDDATIYVTNRNGDTVSVVSNAGASSTLVDTVPTRDFPYVLTTDPDGLRLYVANFNDKSVSVIDTEEGTVERIILLPPTGGGGNPVGLHVSAEGAYLYVATTGGDFHVIDTESQTIVDTINTGVSPADLVFSDLTRSGYIPSPTGGDGLTIVRTVAAGGDADGDGDVDLDDFAAFAACLQGPAGALLPDCDTFDFDDDGDVDADDFAAFQVAFTGPNG